MCNLKILIMTCLLCAITTRKHLTNYFLIIIKLMTQLQNIWFMCLTTFQHLLGYLMPKSDSL